MPLPKGTAPKAPKPAAVKSTVVRQSSKDLATHLRAMILGPPKHGKTTMAATISADYHDGIGDPDNPTYLSDILWLPFDDGALDGLHERNIEMDVIDPELSFYEGQQLVNASEELPKKVKAWVLDKRADDPDRELTIVVDTISTYAGMIEAHFDAMMTNKRDMWGSVFTHHKRLFLNLKRIRANILFLCHTKAVTFMGTDAEKAQIDATKKATGLPGTFEVETDISGKAKKYYINNMSLIFPILAKPVKNKKPAEWERNIHPFGTREIEGASRFVLRLEEKEPADFRILLKKIRGLV